MIEGDCLDASAAEEGFQEMDGWIGRVELDEGRLDEDGFHRGQYRRDRAGREDHLQVGPLLDKTEAFQYMYVIVYLFKEKTG
jgi:hypothetical protein